MRLLHKKQTKPIARRDPINRVGRASDDDLTQRYAFRRNRTLTGSLASGVSSASEQRAELKSSRVQSHDLRRHRRRLGATLVVVFAVCLLLAGLVYQSIAIPNVTALTAGAIDDKFYQAKIQAYLNVHPFERSRLTLNTTNLTTYLQANDCPEVQSVSSVLEFDGLGKTKFLLTLRRPAIVWDENKSRVYVDDNGVAFSRNYYAEPTVKVVDQSGVAVSNNQVLASNRFLSFVGKAVGAMKTAGYTVNQVVLPVNTTRQISLTVEGTAYPIKFSIDRTVGDQVSNATSAIKHLQSRGITPEYIDVRVSGKVFYK